MSSFAVQVVRIQDLEPIEGADRIELARIGGYRSVVPKGDYVVGDFAIYIPEQAIVPQELLREIGLEGRLAGKEKNRVKAVKLRGSLSQGIVCRPSVYFDRQDNLVEDLFQKEANVQEALGISKWVPEVPANMAGEAYGEPNQIRWIDIENVKRFPDVFSTDEIVQVTEKIHGTAFCMTVDFDRGILPTAPQVTITSKGMGSRGLALKPSERNLYWRAEQRFGLARKVQEFVHRWELSTEPDLVRRVGLFGEVYGKGVQDLHYGTESPEFACFDMFVETENNSGWFDYSSIRSLVGVPMVPLLYTGPYDESYIWELASGQECVSGQQANIREGVVVRPLLERTSDILGGRAILKFVSDDYLTRKNGSEFE